MGLSGTQEMHGRAADRTGSSSVKQGPLLHGYVNSNCSLVNVSSLLCNTVIMNVI